MSQAPPARNRRRRPPPRLATVTHIEPLAPYLTRISLSDPSLADWPTGDPTGHCKVFLPGDDDTEPALPTWGENGPVFDESRPRPTVRTYTPRRFDPDTNTLDIDFVLHDAGPASRWAAQASIGDRVAVAGVGRGYAIDPDATRFHLGGDAASIPAISVLLETLPQTANVDVTVELDAGHEPVELPSHPSATVQWRTRPADHEPGSELFDAFRNVTIGATERVWIATEAVAVRKIRKTLLDAGVPRTSLVTRGYWKTGEENHPDGDYAEDD